MGKSGVRRLAVWSPSLGDQLTACVFFGWFVTTIAVRSMALAHESDLGSKTAPWALLITLGCAASLFKSRPTGAWLVGAWSVLMICIGVSLSGRQVSSYLVVAPYVFAAGYCAWRIATRRRTSVLDTVASDPGAPPVVCVAEPTPTESENAEESV
jgi:hypothetical protein